MKTSLIKKTLSLTSFLLFVSLCQAQIANWTFNGTLVGTGSATSVAGNASLGSAISVGNYNGTEYFGEGGWPSGAIDLNAYLEFSITPTSGHSLTIASLAMQIRRSTTGTAGAGPNNWSLRCSLDGYAADIATGPLTMSSTPATAVTFGAAFINVPGKITFRLYGYQATISSGGLSRFVYDNITASGSSILPVAFDYFQVKSNQETVHIGWRLAGEGDLSALRIERAAAGQNFETIKEYRDGQVGNGTSFDYADALDHPSGVYAYRIQLVSGDGQVSYSAIQTVSFGSASGFSVQALGAGSDAVRFRVHAEKSGNFVFTLYNVNGNKIARISETLNAGDQIIQMDNSRLKLGLYILTAENGNQTATTKFMAL